MTDEPNQVRRPSVDTDADVGPTFQPIVAFLGLVIVALGLSGLVDDGGVLKHPWWVTLVAAGIAGCAFVILRTLQSLRADYAPTKRTGSVTG